MGNLVLQRGRGAFACLCEGYGIGCRLCQQVAHLQWRRAGDKCQGANHHRIHAPNDEWHRAARCSLSRGLVLASNIETRLGPLFRGARRRISGERSTVGRRASPFGLCGKDKSVGRILFLSLHFGNTLLLLAALSLTAAWLSNGGGGFALARSRRQVITIGASLFATMVIGITGALSALGDTLFPATSLRAAVLQDFSRGTPALLRFRLLHRPVAVITACYVLRIIFKSSNPAKPYFATGYCAHHRYTCAARHWHDECSTSRPRFSPNPASIRSDVIRTLLVLASPTWCSSVQTPSLALWWQETIRLSEPELRTPGMWL
jgi:hypothetical protein